MSNEKRKRILEAAMSLFSEKGYFTTSVQEIAEKSGVAKGSIYKYFPSKDDLLISIFENYQNEMIKNSNQIKYNPNISTKEVLRQQIITQFDGFLKNRELFKIHFKEQRNHEDEKIKPFILRTKRKMLNWNKKKLLFAFGDDILPYIWDIVIIFQGMLKEYLYIIVFEEKNIDTQYAASFIVERIEAIVKDLLDKKPKPILVNYMVNDIDTGVEDKEIQVSAILKEMKDIIEQKKLDEFLTLVHKLEDELTKGGEVSILFKAYLGYLSKLDELRILVKDLYKILDILD